MSARLPMCAVQAPIVVGRHRVLAVASSTGGPQALVVLLGALPANFPCPVLVAQHIAHGFAPGMVRWLATVCKLPVRLATDGEVVADGTVYVAPSETHMALSAGRRLVLTPPLEGDIYHPSCDHLLGSVAAVCGRDAVGLILTGMGSDGARGMEMIHQAGGATIAQDEASSVIFGMNQVAIARGAAQQVLPVQQIAPALSRLLGLAG